MSTLDDSTLAQDVEELAGEPVLWVRFVPWEACETPDYDETVGARPWSDGREVLSKHIDFEVWDGQSATHSPRFIAWSERWVIYCHEYDCSWMLERLPRNPR